MSGMVNTGNAGVSSHSSRTVKIEVTGVCHQDIARTSNYTVKVPYNRMSQTIQNINRIGGKVAGVYLGGTAPTAKAPSEVEERETSKRSGKKRSRNRK